MRESEARARIVRHAASGGLAVLFCALALALAGVAHADTPAPAAAKEPSIAIPNLLPKGTAEESTACMGCHDAEKFDLDLDNKEVVNLHVDPTALKGSVHVKLECTDCHRDLKGQADGHAGTSFASAREFKSAFAEQCKACHVSVFAKTLNSVHHAAQAKTPGKAPLCTDCHGAHDVAKADQPRSKISKSCASCHQKISVAYAKSVHGKALFEGDNTDVPTCTDCHGAHDIGAPKTAEARLHMPETCGNCHADAKVMDKYKLSTKVFSTYLSDFHGTTVSLQLAEKGKQPFVALCTDCHGVHDIAKAHDPTSPVDGANLLTTCQKCHEGAAPGFQKAWLSHYEPSLTKAPIVYLVKVFYSILIPFMIGGLLLQIILHLWRVVVGR